MGPKKRGLLGSALRQSPAYDSFTVGSGCLCVCRRACVPTPVFPACVYSCVHAHAPVRASAWCQCLPRAFSVC